MIWLRAIFVVLLNVCSCVEYVNFAYNYNLMLLDTAHVIGKTGRGHGGVDSFFFLLVFIKIFCLLVFFFVSFLMLMSVG